MLTAPLPEALPGGRRQPASAHTALAAQYRHIKRVVLATQNAELQRLYEARTISDGT